MFIRCLTTPHGALQGVMDRPSGKVGIYCRALTKDIMSGTIYSQGHKINTQHFTLKKGQGLSALLLSS